MARYKDLIGKRVKLPIIEERYRDYWPIGHGDMEFGTGGCKG